MVLIAKLPFRTCGCWGKNRDGSAHYFPESPRERVGAAGRLVTYQRNKPQQPWQPTPPTSLLMRWECIFAFCAPLVYSRLSVFAAKINIQYL
jgi:hypothetical protein